MPHDTEQIKDKHAYLIMAHGDFDLLELLVSSLDDPRNDLYIHIDAKVEHLPRLLTKRAELSFVAERYDVRWADVSVLWAEFALFRAAYNGGTYSYYHLLSGVDLPIKTQDYIHSFCAEHRGKEFIGFYRGEGLEEEIDRKVRLRHIFARNFRGQGLLWQMKRLLRAVYIRYQKLMGVNRYPQRSFAKGTQWLSITHELVAELLRHERSIVELYPDTFCSDEIAIHTFVKDSPFYERVYDPKDEARSAIRHIGWQNGELKDFDASDYEALSTSEALFARKFNSRDMDFIARVLTLSQGVGTSSK